MMGGRWPSGVLQARCAEAAGRSMFECEPDELFALTGKERADKVQAIKRLPMTAGIIINHDPSRNDTFLCLYDIAKSDMRDMVSTCRDERARMSTRAHERASLRDQRARRSEVGVRHDGWMHGEVGVRHDRSRERRCGFCLS